MHHSDGPFAQGLGSGGTTAAAAFPVQSSPPSLFSSLSPSPSPVPPSLPESTGRMRGKAAHSLEKSHVHVDRAVDELGAKQDVLGLIWPSAPERQLGVAPLDGGDILDG